MGIDLISELSGCLAVLLDIEGTTTSISFVKDVLFPFVRHNLKSYLKTNWGDAELEDDVAALRIQVKNDLENGKAVTEIPITAEEDAIQSAVVKNVSEQMDEDRKTTALKQLQGHMWRRAYTSEEIHGHLYDDVLSFFRHWQQKLGKKIYIYSSGSIEAQKLLFQFSNEGNLLEYISGHFDTTTGSKIQAASYVSIANQIDMPLDKIAFFTDVVKEAVAAKEAGMTPVLVVREGNKPLTKEDTENFHVVHSFNELR